MPASLQLTPISAFYVDQYNDKDSRDDEEDHYDNSYHHTNSNSSSVRDSNSVCRVWKKEMCGGTLVM